MNWTVRLLGFVFAFFFGGMLERGSN
jgi:hypothetical protein